MVAISAARAPGPVRTREIKPLGLFQRIAYPALFALAGPDERTILKQRAALTSREREREHLRRRAAKELKGEAKIYLRLIQTRLASLSMYHRPSNETDGPERRMKPKRVQLVEFEIVKTSPERIYYKIKTRKSALFGQTNALPYTVRVLEIIHPDTLVELSHACHRTVEAIADDYRYGAWLVVNRLDSVGGLPKLVQFKEVLEHYPAGQADRLPILLGVGDHRAIHYIFMADHAHGLLGGSTGSGKSNMLNNIICQWLRFIPASDLHLYGIDLKRLELAFYEDDPHFKRLNYEPEGAIETLNELLEEMMRRRDLFARKVKDLTAWNSRYPDQALPRIVLIIDEFADLMLASGGDVAKEVENLVTRIGNLGRAPGIHLLLCTQRPAKEVVSNGVRVNMPFRIVGRVQNNAQSMVLTDDGSAADLPLDPRGRMLYFTGTEHHEIQTPLITDDDVKASVKLSRGLSAGIIILDPISQKPIILPESLKSFIIEQHEGRLNRAAGGWLSEFGIGRGLFEEFGRGLIKTGQAEKRGAYWVVCGTPLPPEPDKKDIALASLRAIRQSKGAQVGAESEQP